MPNWTTNTFTVSGDADAIARLRAEYMTDGRLDFAKVIPYPEGFDSDLPAGTGEEAADFYLGAKEKHTRPRSFYEQMFNEQRAHALKAKAEVEAGGEKPAARTIYEEAYLRYETYADFGAAYVKNIELTGHKNWYEFNCANWGTKWGASDTELLVDLPDVFEIRFATAWCEPAPIFERLHELFPTLDMKYVAEHEGDDTITGRRYYAEDIEG